MTRIEPQIAAVLASVLLLAAPAGAVSPAERGGAIAGIVASGSGIPQMGATVFLYNRYERLLEKVLTNEKGAFVFDSLLPDVYSVRVHLASFVPAVKGNISVQPGMRSFLSINLASVFSSIELVYMAPGQGSLMSDDWKWVLRSSMATRPVLRLLPELRETSHSTAIFSQTRGLVKLSAGDGAASSLGAQPDLGTAFALATSLFGNNQLQFSGNLGFGSRLGTPTAGFRTRYSHGDEFGGLNSEVNLTMRQIYLPGRAGQAFLGAGNTSAPALRTMAASFVDRAKFTDDIEFLYGGTLESVQFLDRLNYLSPFARLTYAAGDIGTFEIGASSGTPPVELYQATTGPDNEMHQDLATLALFPRVSLLNGRATVQRAENLEIGYRKTLDGRTFSAGVYHEQISNAALTAAVPAGLFSTSDLLPDLFSNASILNIGRYSGTGLMASVMQPIGEQFSVSAAYGNGTNLATRDTPLMQTNAADLRNLIRRTRRNWVLAKVSGVAPITGTRFTTSYQWTDYNSLTPGHQYLTQRIHPDAGLNIYLRQPIPGFGGMPGRLEATAELRNLLAQGYLPIATADGRQVFLIQSPRAVRGGLSFIF